MKHIASIGKKNLNLNYAAFLGNMANKNKYVYFFNLRYNLYSINLCHLGYFVNFFLLIIIFN